MPKEVTVCDEATAIDLHKTGLVSQLRDRGLSAFAWDFLGKLGTQGVGFLFTILLARLLSPAEFGLMAMVMVVIGFASIFTDMGLASALIQRANVQSVHYSTVFHFNIVLGLTLSIMTFLCAEGIGSLYGQSEVVPLAQVLSISFLVNSFGSTQTTKLRKELNYSTLTRARFFSSLVSGLLGLIMAFNGLGVWSLVVQSLALGVVYNCLIWSWSKWRPQFQFSILALRELWSFGFHMFLAGLLQNAVTRLDYLIIGKLFTASTLGFYDRAKSLTGLVTKNFSGSLMTVLFPVLSRVQSDIPRLRSIVLNLFGALSFVTFLLVGALYLVSQELIFILFGPKWQASVPYFEILIISSFSLPLSGLLMNVLRGLGKSRMFLRLEVIKKSIAVTNLAVLYFFGIYSYLYGLILVAILATSINLWAACREISVSVYTAAVPVATQAAIAILSVMAVLYASQFFELKLVGRMFFETGLFLSLYVAASVVLRTSSYRDFMGQLLPLLHKRKSVLGRDSIEDLDQ